jgi:hypothetical protein
MPNSLNLRLSDPDDGSERIRKDFPQPAEARVTGSGESGMGEAATQVQCRY